MALTRPLSSCVVLSISSFIISGHWCHDGIYEGAIYVKEING